MARLFTAIDFPDQVRESLANLCFGIRKARWVPMDQLHLTIRFIGEVDDGTYERIRQQLDEVRVASFNLTLKGVGHFPPRRNPNVIWAGVENSPALMTLHDQIERSLRDVGLDPEGRKFHPHVTLARMRDPIPVREIIPFLSANALFTLSSIPIEEFHLYSSILTRDGPIHRREETYSLLGS